MTVAQADSTYAAIERKVRRLTASASEASLPSVDIQRATNTFYNQDFPYAIKIDQMRDVYTFYTRPNIDRYPLDINYNQGVRSPFYVDGIQGTLYKERQQFFNVWPKFPNKYQPISGDGTTQQFNFTIAAPFLSGMVTLGGVSTSGAAISVADDGNGTLYLQTPNPVTSNPPYSDNPTVPGMHNLNEGNPGLLNVISVGSVNYVTGVFALDFTPAAVTPAAGTQMTLWVSPYQTGRPYSMLFWNNEFTIRPVPDLIHQITVETYQTPVQFLQTTDNPIVNQWWQYISYGVSMEILRERQDMDGVSALNEGFKRQEALVLERQGIEEINTATPTLFNSPMQNYINNGQGGGGFW